ncbi:MAG: glucose 1-dehydrogenase [Verrucomicrobia bacterium]|nr:glucose 1-dehydrogenase [Verrucomicrobiota bacterium]
MQTSFENKVVLITGATSGIGKVSALAFAKAGAKVIVSGRREAEGQAVVAEIKAGGGEAAFVKADVAVEADVAALVAKTVATYGRLDVAFNNAGVELTGAIVDANEADYRRVFDINVWGVLASMKHEIPVMLKQGGGVIINTSSVAGHVGMAGAGVYVASKHAVEGLTKAAALEYAKQGIRVNAVAPAAIETDMMNRFTGGGNEEALNYMRSLHPVGRLGRAEEIANPVLFLASDAASFITGASLNIDGGLLAQ